MLPEKTRLKGFYQWFVLAIFLIVSLFSLYGAGQDLYSNITGSSGDGGSRRILGIEERGAGRRLMRLVGSAGRRQHSFGHAVGVGMH